MKGPGLKLDLDVRRLWKCPQTGETIRLSGDVVSKSTHVEGAEVFMQLVEEKRSLYRDPYHFDYYELPSADQSSSERAAAAARSIDEMVVEETTLETAVPEQSAPEVSAETAEESKTDTLPTENQEQALDQEDDGESFGGGLL